MRLTLGSLRNLLQETLDQKSLLDLASQLQAVADGLQQVPEVAEHARTLQNIAVDVAEYGKTQRITTKRFNPLTSRMDPTDFGGLGNAVQGVGDAIWYSLANDRIQPQDPAALKQYVTQLYDIATALQNASGASGRTLPR